MSPVAEVIHVVRLEPCGKGQSVYGHPTADCFKGCEERDTHWFIGVDATRVEAGKCYEVDQFGDVINEV